MPKATLWCATKARGKGRGTLAVSMPLRASLLSLLSLLALAPASPATGGETYAELAPILAEHCIACHSGDAAPLGLRLDSFDGILQGSARGPVVKRGDSSASELIRRIRGTTQPRMPMTGPPFLPENQIAMFEHWIDGGLQMGVAPAPGPPLGAASARRAPGEPVTYLHVAPIFARRCAKCHAEKGVMGSPPEGFRLTSYETTLSSDDRVRVVPGKPEVSELVRRIRGQSTPRMPFDGPPYLTPDEIGLIEDWIMQGARDAAGAEATLPSGGRVRLHGTLGTGWSLDGAALAVTRRTRLDKSPHPGDYVEVRGHLDATGSVIAERIRPR